MSNTQILSNIYNNSINRISLEDEQILSKKDFIELSIRELSQWSPSCGQTSIDNSLFNVIDFFSGCGGMSLGFHSISRKVPFFKILGGIDIEKDALKTFSHNFDASGILSDIRQLTEKSPEIVKLLEKTKNGVRKPLVIIGCAPCQGFSAHTKKNWNKTEDLRNTLVGSFARLAVKMEPECIVMENVPELLSKRYGTLYESAKEIFINAGYIIKQGIFNTAGFGVPQERVRALVIAMKKDFSLPPAILEPGSYNTVRHAIGHLPIIEHGEICSSDIMHKSARHKSSTLETIRAVPKNGGSRPAGIGPQCLDKVKGFSDVYGRLSWDKPSITITHYARNPASGRFVHPEQDRGLSMREAALLQSFPERFKFYGDTDSTYKQIGEAVPPKFSAAVAANVLYDLLIPRFKELISADQSIEQPVNNSFASVMAG